MTNLPKPNPISAWGMFFCCCGYIWTIISYFQVATSINTMLGSQKTQGWAVLIPIYGQIHISDMVKSLNQIIEKEKLDIQPIQENMVLNILFSPITLMWLFKGNLDVASAIEAKSK
mgnify:FL=1|jgi:hypothetical protein